MHHIYNQKGTGHVGVVSSLSFLRSCDRTSVVGKLYLVSQLFIIEKMSVTRSSKSTGKRVDVASQEGTIQPPPSQANQSRAQDESLSQTSPTPPSPGDLRREDGP